MEPMALTIGPIERDVHAGVRDRLHGILRGSQIHQEVGSDFEPIDLVPGDILQFRLDSAIRLPLRDRLRPVMKSRREAGRLRLQGVVGGALFTGISLERAAVRHDLDRIALRRSQGSPVGDADEREKQTYDGRQSEPCSCLQDVLHRGLLRRSVGVPPPGGTRIQVGARPRSMEHAVPPRRPCSPETPGVCGASPGAAMLAV